MTAGDVITITENSDGKKANYYDGVDDYMLADAHAVARVAAGDTVGTYTAWIYVESIGTTMSFLSAGDNNGTEFFAFKVDSFGKLRAQLFNLANQFNVVETTASMEAKKWHHVAVVQTGIRPTLYVDGLAVAMTDDAATDLTFWYAGLTLVDKFAIGVRETNGTHIEDFMGAIGRVKYFSKALDARQILMDYKGETADASVTAALQLNLTMEEDGTTDSGLGLDNGTLTGDAYYGGIVSDWSYQVGKNTTGHAAEFINSYPDGSKYISVIKRGD